MIRDVSGQMQSLNLKRHNINHDINHTLKECDCPEQIETTPVLESSFCLVSFASLEYYYAVVCYASSKHCSTNFMVIFSGCHETPV